MTAWEIHLAYEASPKFKAAHTRYEASPKGKARKARYRASPKGKAKRAAWAREKRRSRYGKPGGNARLF